MAGILRHSWGQLREIDQALRTMRRFGILEESDAFRVLSKARGEVMGRMGLRIPRAMTLITKLVGLSPGIIKLHHDGESGWLTEARELPGSRPIFHYVSDEVAMAILKGELTHELEAVLMTPDPYQGE